MSEGPITEAALVEALTVPARVAGVSVHTMIAQIARLAAGEVRDGVLVIERQSVEPPLYIFDECKALSPQAFAHVERRIRASANRWPARRKQIDRRRNRNRLAKASRRRNAR